MSPKEDLKIKLISTFTMQEQKEILLRAFDYLLVKLPEELKKQKLIKQTAEKSATYN